MEPTHPALAAAIDESRLWDRLMRMGAIGALPEPGGVDRPALSAHDATARRLLVAWGRACGLRPASDSLGNLFLLRPGTGPDLPPVVIGSHLDTQPLGGRFDGAYGVLAALEVVAALDDLHFETRRPIAVVSWTNEEGCRFQPGCAGSAGFVGAVTVDQLRAGRDAEGIGFGEALDQMLAGDRADGLAVVPLGFPIAAYLEAHIEQGPQLERTGADVGIVTGMPCLHWYTVTVTGEAAHAGTTPRAARKDALSAACSMVKALEAVTADPQDVLRFTVGRFEVAPNSPNTVPDQVLFTLDLRHPDAAVLAALAARIPAVVASNAGPCRAVVTRTMAAPPRPFDPGLIALLQREATAIDLATLSLPSGAYHDARYLAERAPAAMIFVPCRGGISHHPSEYAEPAHLAAGARLLAAATVAVACRDD